jgi:hypothetical protein
VRVGREERREKERETDTIDKEEDLFCLQKKEIVDV